VRILLKHSVKKTEINLMLLGGTYSHLNYLKIFNITFPYQVVTIRLYFTAS